jgi:hypothetical protein
VGDSVDTVSESLSPEQREKALEVAHWINEIDAAHKRDKEYRKEGKRILDIYAGGKNNPFAILYSNTETLLPALYSAVPRPVVQRRFKDEDKLGKLAAQAGQRVLEFLVDTNVDGYETFDDGVRSAVLTALLPGRGATGVKYEHETQEVVPDGAAEGTAPVPVKNWETVCMDSKPWDRMLHGYAKKWSKVPWIAYELHLDRDAAEKAGIPASVLSKIVFTKGEDAEVPEDATKKKEDEEHIGERQTALFYQIWDKDGGRKIKYLCPQFKEDLCAVLDDTLELTGFFDCPKPMQFVERVHDLAPVALYSLYEDQAVEVNDLTRRIKKLIAAIKARGVYDTELGDDIKRILDSEEGDLVPADKSSSLAAEKGLQNAIWMWPVEKLILVLKELYVAREAAKRVIYEITGISDIIRGSTVASETATAQEIKSQWGTLRLKRLQKEVQRYARDLLRMMLDVAAHKFSERTWAQMTGLPFATTEANQSAQMIAAAAQAFGQPLDEQTQRTLAMPVWGEILAVLKDDLQRAYRIDIESNSTVEPEATEDQEMIAEVMNALAQYLNGVAPLVISGALPFEAAQAMMLAIVRRFRFGPEIEDYVKAMQAPKPEDDGKAGAAAAAQQKAEQKVAEVEMKSAQDKMAGDAEKQALQKQLQDASSTNALQKREADLALREAKLANAEECFNMAKQYADKERKLNDDRAAMQMDGKKKEVEGVAKVADAKVKSANDAVKKTEAPTKAAQEVKDALAQFMQQMTVMIADLKESIDADQVPDRGADGRITRVRRERKRKETMQ